MPFDRIYGLGADSQARTDAAMSHVVAVIQIFFGCIGRKCRFIDFAESIRVLTCGLRGNVIGFRYPPTTPNAVCGEEPKSPEDATVGVRKSGG